MTLPTALSDTRSHRALEFAPDEITMHAKSPLNVNWQLSPRTNRLRLLKSLSSAQLYGALEISPDNITNLIRYPSGKSTFASER